MLGRDGEFYQLRFHVGGALESWLLKAGRLPLPPYIQRDPGVDDDERYQTVFARELGAVAAPTAGLHFDEALLASLRGQGVEFGHVTLHVGAGTFQPVRVDDVREHRMHSEWLNVGAALVEQVRATRARGGRVIAVGTTVVRALESASHDGELQSVRRRDADLHLPRLSHPQRGRDADQFPPAGKHVVDAGVCVQRQGADFFGVRACGARKVPILLVWRCDVAVPGDCAVNFHNSFAVVIPAKAGTQGLCSCFPPSESQCPWVPAFAGTDGCRGFA